jgi:site-specific DNA-methyltransferase (cytosine-N4-specific)
MMLMKFELRSSAKVYETSHGLQVSADSREILRLLPSESVDLVITSPPFALLRQKSYGNEEQAGYVAWLGEFGKAAHRVLKETGSFVLDLGGAYERGKPVRSLYNFRVLIDFCDRLRYNLAEEFFWYNPAKLPSPIEWVNKRKIRVKDAVNTVWWFSKGDYPEGGCHQGLDAIFRTDENAAQEPGKVLQTERATIGPRHRGGLRQREWRGHSL